MPCAIRRFERNWFHKDWFYSFKFKGRRESGPKNPPEKAKRRPLVWRGLSELPKLLPSWLRLTSGSAMPLEWRSVFGDPMGIRHDSNRAGPHSWL